MIIYVDANAGRYGNGSPEMPFKKIGDAAQTAAPVMRSSYGRVSTGNM